MWHPMVTSGIRSAPWRMFYEAEAISSTNALCQLRLRLIIIDWHFSCCLHIVTGLECPLRETGTTKGDMEDELLPVRQVLPPHVTV